MHGLLEIKFILFVLRVEGKLLGNSILLKLLDLLQLFLPFFINLILQCVRVNKKKTFPFYHFYEENINSKKKKTHKQISF